MPPSAETNAFVCRIIGHRRSRRIWHEGDTYRAQCKRCGTDLVRPRGGTNWAVLPADAD